MSLDKDDWGSNFGCDPDWHYKKIASLEESLVLAKRQRDIFEMEAKAMKLRLDVAENNLEYYKRKSEDFDGHIKMLEERLAEQAKRISQLEGNPQNG